MPHAYLYYVIRVAGFTEFLQHSKVWKIDVIFRNIVTIVLQNDIYYVLTLVKKPI